MPIPFEEKNEKIKVTCDLGISVDSEARIPVEVACGEQEQPVGSSEDSALEPGGGSLTDVSARAIYTAAPLVKAKKKRLPELVSLIVGILPLFAFLTVLVSDPAAIPFLQAEYFDGMTPKVIEDINRAYRELLMRLVLICEQPYSFLGRHLHCLVISI